MDSIYTKKKDRFNYDSSELVRSNNVPITTFVLTHYINVCLFSTSHFIHFKYKPNLNWPLVTENTSNAETSLTVLRP